MGLKIERKSIKRAGYGKSGNPQMEGHDPWKRGKWDPKTKRYAPKVVGAEKVIKDKKKPYWKPKKKIGKRSGPSMRGKSRKK